MEQDFDVALTFSDRFGDGLRGQRRKISKKDDFSLFCLQKRYCSIKCTVFLIPNDLRQNILRWVGHKRIGAQRFIFFLAAIGKILVSANRQQPSLELVHMCVGGVQGAVKCDGDDLLCNRFIFGQAKCV